MLVQSINCRKHLPLHLPSSRFRSSQHSNLFGSQTVLFAPGNRTEPPSVLQMAELPPAFSSTEAGGNIHPLGSGVQEKRSTGCPMCRRTEFLLWHLKKRFQQIKTEFGSRSFRKVLHARNSFSTRTTSKQELRWCQDLQQTRRQTGNETGAFHNKSFVLCSQEIVRSAVWCGIWTGSWCCFCHSRRFWSHVNSVNIRVQVCRNGRTGAELVTSWGRHSRWRIGHCYGLCENNNKSIITDQF